VPPPSLPPLPPLPLSQVTDFGISTRFGRKDYTAETGTYRQMAPEVILHKPYNYKCDVYSYGILLWEALHRQVPFTGFAPLQAAFAVAMEQARPQIALREELRMYAELITACWDAEPRNRPDMDQVVRVTADCCAALEQQQQQQPAPPPPAQGEGGVPSNSTPRQGLRSLTGALASKLSFNSGRSSNSRAGGGGPGGGA
jgi:serine/threonine protein kinase